MTYCKANYDLEQHLSRADAEDRRQEHLEKLADDYVQTIINFSSRNRHLTDFLKNRADELLWEFALQLASKKMAENTDEEEINRWESRQDGQLWEG